MIAPRRSLGQGTLLGNAVKYLAPALRGNSGRLPHSVGALDHIRITQLSADFCRIQTTRKARLPKTTGTPTAAAADTLCVDKSVAD